MSSRTLVLRNPRVFVVVLVLASLLTSGFILAGVLVPQPVPVAFADDGDKDKKKECENNEGGNNCNDTKKSASPKLECEHNIKNNKDSAIDSQCTNNSQILIDSNIESRGNDGEGDFPPTSITLDPTLGPSGTVVNVFGTGFDENGAAITITFDGKVVATTTTDNEGNFSTIFEVFTPVLGPHVVTGKAVLSKASATFTVTSGRPVVHLEPNSGPSGTLVNITGLNYEENSLVNILYDGFIILEDFATNDIGRFSATFKVPGGVTGPHDVTAVDVDDPSLSAGDQFTLTGSVTTTSTATLGMIPF